jgi:hypothetical protein
MTFPLPLTTLFTGALMETRAPGADARLTLMTQLTSILLTGVQVRILFTEVVLTFMEHVSWQMDLEEVTCMIRFTEAHL